VITAVACIMGGIGECELPRAGGQIGMDAEEMRVRAGERAGLGGEDGSSLECLPFTRYLLQYE